jgi:hypothetical protein
MMGDNMTPESFYVYGYYDPNTNELFYVGKGSDYRDMAHMKPSCWESPEKTQNPFFYDKIKSLMKSGQRPIVKRLFENVTEDEAYRIENELILEHGRRFVGGGTLFNISDNRGGSRKGRKNPWTEERKGSHKSLYANRRLANDRDELAEMFLVRCMSKREISEYYGVSEVLIKKRLQEFGIQKSEEQKKNTRDRAFTKCRKVIECSHCTNQFTVTSSQSRKFCSTECASKNRLEEVVFKGVRYENKYDAAEKTGLSHVYIAVYKDK